MINLTSPLPEAVYASAVPMKRLFDMITHADSVDLLTTNFVNVAASYFDADRADLILFADYPYTDINQDFLENPVVRYINEHHEPIYEAIVLDPTGWNSICPWADDGHVMAGPIVHEGNLIAALVLTRPAKRDAFSSRDLADIGALCFHLRAWFARWTPANQVNPDGLTLREMQIVELVAVGFTNSQIGDRLFVSTETVKTALKSIFRKTGVSSRTQLAVRHTRQAEMQSS
jgi:DNA-binding CsgD family transcriptional regulator